ncbi:MAG: hypothetical protein HUJ80_03120, partial [Firmicutes bacterium]|nr:hypothetical protein [Bacillota bacterium]
YPGAEEDLKKALQTLSSMDPLPICPIYPAYYRASRSEAEKEAFDE